VCLERPALFSLVPGVKALAKMPRSRGVLFEVHCSSTAPGERIGVCGSSEELGSWDPHKCLELVTSDQLFPMWVGTDAVEVNPSTKYKFVILSPGKCPRWEDGKDRVVPPDVSSQGRVWLASRFNSRWQFLLPDRGAEALEAADATAEEVTTEASDLHVPAVGAFGKPDRKVFPSQCTQSAVSTQAERREEVQPPPPSSVVHETGVADTHVASETAPAVEEVQEAEVHEPPPITVKAPRPSPMSPGSRLAEVPPAVFDLDFASLFHNLDAEGSCIGSLGTPEIFSCKVESDFYSLEGNRAENSDASTDPDASSGKSTPDEVDPDDDGNGILKARAAPRASSDVVIRFVRRFSNDLSSLASGATSDRTARLAAAGAAAGGAAGGTGGAFTGFAVGSVAGAACGLPPAVLTLGLSVPIGAVLGAGAGLGLGAAFGATAGAVGGGVAGYGVAKRTEAKAEL